MMKKLLFSAFALGLANLCSAQTTVKKEEVKFTPPVIKKDKPVVKTASTTKLTSPVIVKDEIKFAAPAIKKNKAVKKNRKAKPISPVIVKDASIN